MFVHFFPTTISKSKPFVRPGFPIITHHLTASQSTPPTNVPPPKKKTTSSRPYDEGLLTIGFPLTVIRPAIKNPYF